MAWTVPAPVVAMVVVGGATVAVVVVVVVGAVVVVAVVDVVDGTVVEGVEVVVVVGAMVELGDTAVEEVVAPIEVLVEVLVDVEPSERPTVTGESRSGRLASRAQPPVMPAPPSPANRARNRRRGISDAVTGETLSVRR